MFVNIVLEHPHEHYTNLDLIQGKVLLRVPNPANISSIIVKLEGEARTRLLAPIHPSRPDKQRPVLEVHKFLYNTQVLFPPNTRQEDLAQNPKAVFAINTGSFEYPFQFKVRYLMVVAILPASLTQTTAPSQYAMPTIEQPHLQCLVYKYHPRVRKNTDTTRQGDTSTHPQWLSRRGRDSVLCQGDGK